MPANEFLSSPRSGRDAGARPYVIGLTGGIGCGKSEAAKYLEALGAVRFDADEVSRALTAPGGEALPAIRGQFGDGVFRPDGALDRAALARIVFSSAPHRRALEAILHPLVQREMLRRLDAAAEAGERVVVLEVPLLFETGMDALCDETWVLYLDREMQISRIAVRDGLSREDAEARIDSQMPAEERNARATRVINTDQPIERTRSELSQLFHAALKRA